MAGSMLPFVASQVQAVVEGIRLLEFFVTAPLGLHADIEMLRESLPLAEAADLPVRSCSSVAPRSGS